MQKNQKKFDRNQSVLRNIYLQLKVEDPWELEQLILEEDQRLMKHGEWDYKNKDLFVNKVREMIEKTDLENIKDRKEKRYIQNTLWLWYHHAISCALWFYGDKKAAQEFSAKALKLQPKNHPNKITRLLYLLTRDNLADAEKWFEKINTEPEHSTALHSLNLYKQGNFFKPGAS